MARRIEDGDEILGAAFRTGDLVYVQGRGNVLASVIGEPRQYSGGFEYQVLVDGSLFWFNEHLLTKEDTTTKWRSVRREELLRELAIAKLSHRLADSLYTYRASRTSFEAYQFHPVLKFVRNPNHRILIADEVGLGKTIEASLIYLELKERLSISRTMILCPSRLTHKWKAELESRFDEQFTVLNSSGIRQALGLGSDNAFARPIRVISSYETLRRQEFLDILSERLFPLDLLIVDEAHYMRNESSKTFTLGSTLVNASDAVVFLTATPLHLRNRDLFNLLNLLAPDEFGDAAIFDDQVEPNAHLNVATRLLAQNKVKEALEELKRVEVTSQRKRFIKNPFYCDVREELRRVTASREVSSPSWRVRMQREIQDLNTLSNVLSRTRKRDVAMAAQRAPYSVRIQLTDRERQLYDAILAQTRLKLESSGSSALGWGAMMPERQAASCLPAIARKLALQSQGSTTSLDIDRSQFDLLEDETDPTLSSTDHLTRLSKELGTVDSKFDKFLEVLRPALTETADSKALVFSFFKTTLNYLANRLRAERIPFELLSGDVSVRDRPRIIDRFRESPEIKVLLSSEVGAEGLDFQFCNILVNYDLPWNPMQVEQRIGRLDRFGQKHDRIRIYNFYIEGSIETRIFQRLYERIGLFERSIGDLEEILGEEITQISRKVVQGALTAEEENRLLDVAEHRIARARQNLEYLEENKDELMGPTDILDQRVKETIESGRFVSKEEVQAIVRTFLAARYPKSDFEHDEDEPVATIRFDPELRGDLSRFIMQNDLLASCSDHLLSVTSGQRERIPVTFDSEYAQHRTLLEFVTPRHPLTRMAIRHWQNEANDRVPRGDIYVKGVDDEAGLAYFFVFLLEIGGALESVTLETVLVKGDGAVAVNSADRVLSSIQSIQAIPRNLEDCEISFDEAFVIASNELALRRGQKEIDARRRNDALVLARSTATRATYEAKIRQTNQWLETATNESIIRMRRSQILNLEAKMESMLGDIERKRDVSVGSRLIAGGRALVTSTPPL